jgi:hypothetical protein
MKTINLNCWASYERNVPVPITDPPVANINNLYYSFFCARGLAIFYYRLSGIVLYNVLYENDYFNEED